MVKQKSATTGTKPISEPMPMTCNKCQFLSSQGTDNFRIHYCQRFPKAEIVSPSHWCGEWRSKDA
jgi:hypothetical protein